MMRVLVVDDERLARQELRRLLAAHPQVEVAGEAASAGEGAAQVAALAPDLVLLNLQMPGGSGYDMLATLDEVPEVIFTTGHGPGSPDVLLKPIAPQRLAAALQSAAIRAAAGHAPRRLLLRDGENCRLVRLADIHLFESEGVQTRAYFSGGSALLGAPLPQLERKLDLQQFFRANARQIVNLADVRRIAGGEGGALALDVAGLTVPVMCTIHHAL